VSGEFTSSELRFRKRVRVRAQDALTAFVVQLDMKKGRALASHALACCANTCGICLCIALLL
jgi:hypothetical protein